jgi:hypothetical protein
MRRKYNYFYKISNIINHKFYYGVHKTDDLDDGYMGSGTRLKYAFKKYGKKNFKKEILKFFNSYNDALLYEEYFVNESLVKNNECYNIKIGGSGGWDHVNSKRSKEEYQKLCGWQDYEKRMKVWNSVPLENRKKIGKYLGENFGGKNKLSQNEIDLRLDLIKDIDLRKFGWVSKVSKKLNITHTQTKRFIDKYYKGDIYRRNKPL